MYISDNIVSMNCLAAFHKSLWSFHSRFTHFWANRVSHWFNKPFIKGIVHPKMKILSSFTHPQVVPNLYECLCSAEHKGRYSDECGKQSSSGAPLTSIVFFFPTMEVNGAPKQPGYKLSSKYLPLCSAEQVISFRFRTTWGWVNDEEFSFLGELSL